MILRKIRKLTCLFFGHSKKKHPWRRFNVFQGNCMDCGNKLYWEPLTPIFPKIKGKL